MLNTQTTPKKRLFLDMDGVLAEYRSFESPEQYLQPGYYESLKPHQNVIDGIKQFKRENPDVEIYVISAYYVAPGAVAPQEKRAWLQEHFPEIEDDHIIFTPCGEPKENYIEGGIGKNDYLLDDYSFNLENFVKSGGNAIKLLNGINNKRGSWQSNQLSYRKTPSSFAKALKDIVVNEKEVRHSIEEVQLRNEKEGLTLYINKEELANIVNRYFNEFNNVEDFRANATEEHWGALKRIAMAEAPSTKIVPHVSLGQFRYEFNTFENKFKNALSSLSIGLKNKSEALFTMKETISSAGANLEAKKDKPTQMTRETLLQIRLKMDVAIKDAIALQNSWEKNKSTTFKEIQDMIDDFFDKHDNLNDEEKQQLLVENGVTVETLKEQLLEAIVVKQKEIEIFDRTEINSIKDMYAMVDKMHKKVTANYSIGETQNKSCADDVLENDGINGVPATNFDEFDTLDAVEKQ